MGTTYKHDFTFNSSCGYANARSGNKKKNAGADKRRTDTDGENSNNLTDLSSFSLGDEGGLPFNHAYYLKADVIDKPNVIVQAARTGLRVTLGSNQR